MDRYWSKVDRRGPDECWPWLAGKGGHGYGVFYPGGGKQELAHRMALKLTVGEPEGGRNHALHSCGNKPCCNPAHLRWGTHADNMNDARLDGVMFAPNRRPEKCPSGHLMTDANTLFKTKRRNGRTYTTHQCRECNRIYLQQRRLRRTET
jgi:hypothetical protein